MIIFFPAIVP